jgi:hypothetical protein
MMSVSNAKKKKKKKKKYLQHLSVVNLVCCVTIESLMSLYIMLTVKPSIRTNGRKQSESLNASTKKGSLDLQ